MTGKRETGILQQHVQSRLDRVCPVDAPGLSADEICGQHELNVRLPAELQQRRISGLSRDVKNDFPFQNPAGGRQRAHEGCQNNRDHQPGCVGVQSRATWPHSPLIRPSHGFSFAQTNRQRDTLLFGALSPEGRVPEMAQERFGDPRVNMHRRTHRSQYLAI
jgi:hypothetical protein